MEYKKYSLLCQQYLDIVYHNMPGDRARHQGAKQNISLTYGEILYQGIATLLSLFPLSDNDVFVDLGSGIGKIVLQVFMSTPIKEARGIELSPEFHEQAILANDKIQQELPQLYYGDRKVSFISGSFLEVPLSMATVVIVNSICYSQTFLRQLGNIIDNTPTIHTFMSLRPINTMQRLRFKKVERIECSWDSVLCYIYCS
jgi:hypothetical protein